MEERRIESKSAGSRISSSRVSSHRRVQDRSLRNALYIDPYFRDWTRSNGRIVKARRESVLEYPIFNRVDRDRRREITDTLHELREKGLSLTALLGDGHEAAILSYDDFTNWYRYVHSVGDDSKKYIFFDINSRIFRDASVPIMDENDEEVPFYRRDRAHREWKKAAESDDIMLDFYVGVDWTWMLEKPFHPKLGKLERFLNSCGVMPAFDEYINLEARRIPRWEELLQLSDSDT